MNIEKKISVILETDIINANFNRCLNSLIKQTYKNIEIILNVQSDYKEAEKLLSLDDRIVISDTHKQIFTGDYVFFIKQDDYLSVDYFRLMLSNRESDLIISKIVFDNGNVIKHNNSYTSALNLDLNIEKHKDLFINEFKEYLDLGNVLISKDLYLANDKNNIYKLAENITQSTSSIYYCIKTVDGQEYSIYSNELEDLKNKMLSDEFKYISFDIFDTLILRPFHEPSDLFGILDGKYFELTNSKTSFKRIRMDSEILLRREISEKDKSIQDITITEIYDYISDTYKIDKGVTNKLKEFEINLEVEFCLPRKVSKEIFDMLLYVGKDIILVSDMYLEYKDIVAILEKNKYTNFKKLYISSQYKKTKSSSELFEHVMQELNCKPNEIIHLGDNYNADVKGASKVGITGVYYPRTLEIFENKISERKTNKLSNFISEGLNATNGLELSKALIANKIFDNPFTSVTIDNNFNYSYYNFGYYVIGTYLLSILEDLKVSKCDKFGVIAEYNSLVYEGLKILNNYEKIFKELVSVYLTREEGLTLIINTETDLLNLPLDYYKYSREDIIKILQCDVIDEAQDKASKFCDITNFRKFIMELAPFYFDDKDVEENINRVKTKIKVYNQLDLIFDCSNNGDVLDFFNTKTKQFLNFSNIEETFIRESKTLDMATIQRGALDFVNDFYSEFYKYTEYFVIDKTQFKNVFINFFSEVNNKDKDMFKDIYLNDCIYKGSSKTSLSNFMKKQDIKYAFENSENKVIMDGVINNRKVVCFGSGKIFSNFLNKNYNIDIAFILDNDISKKGQFVGDYEIKTLNDINDFNEHFIIITTAYYRQIEEQLLGLGLFKYSNFISYKDI